MKSNSVLYRFRIQFSDVDRGKYENLDFRLAMHPSESHDFLLTRVFAYVLNHQEGLVFSPGGLSDPDEPCLSIPDPMGGLLLSIEIGNPSARRLHKASKASKKVKVYTYKNPDALVREIAGGNIHNVQRLEMFSFTPSFLARVQELLERDNAWAIMHNDGSLLVSCGEDSVEGEITPHAV